MTLVMPPLWLSCPFSSACVDALLRWVWPLTGLCVRVARRVLLLRRRCSAAAARRWHNVFECVCVCVCLCL